MGARIFLIGWEKQTDRVELLYRVITDVGQLTVPLSVPAMPDLASCEIAGLDLLQRLFLGVVESMGWATVTT